MIQHNIKPNILKYWLGIALVTLPLFALLLEVASWLFKELRITYNSFGIIGFHSVALWATALIAGAYLLGTSKPQENE